MSTMFKSLNFQPVRQFVLLLGGLGAIAFSPAFAQTVSPGAVQPQEPPQDIRQSDADITIPAVGQRQVNVDAGSQIQVNQFAVQYDHLALLDEQIVLSVEAFLNEVTADKQFRFSFGDLEEVANNTTQFLRDSGYLLAQAVLPAQDVKDGVVTLQVLLGVLGSVTVENNALYDSNVAHHVLDKGIDAIVESKNIESSILRLNDLPGLSAAAVFKPGTRLGETHLTLDVTEEQSVNYFAQVDNYGVETTGDVRALLSMDVNNITGHRDRLTLTAVQTFNPGDLLYGHINYEITLPDLVHTLGIAYQETDYQVEGAFAELGVEGQSRIGEIYLRSQWLRQLNQNFSTLISLASKQATVDYSILGGRQGEDQLSVLEVGAIYDAVLSSWVAIHRATLFYSHGFNDLLGSMGKMDAGTLSQGSGEFDKVTASYDYLQTVSQNNALLVRLKGQYSDDNLSSLEQFSLGGPYSVRAYPVAEYVQDKGYFGSVAWVLYGGIFSSDIAYGDYGWSDILSVSVFWDYGWGELTDTNNSASTLAGAGVEFDIKFPNLNSFAKISAAKPTSHVDAVNGEDFQYWISAGINF